MSSSDTYTSGRYAFTDWSKQRVEPCGHVFFNRWFGVFNPEMSGTKANRLLKHEHTMTESGQEKWIRGWEDARCEYKK